MSAQASRTLPTGPTQAWPASSTTSWTRRATRASSSTTSMFMSEPPRVSVLRWLSAAFFGQGAGEIVSKESDSLRPRDRKDAPDRSSRPSPRPLLPQRSACADGVQQVQVWTIGGGLASPGLSRKYGARSCCLLGIGSGYSRLAAEGSGERGEDAIRFQSHP